MSLKIETVRAVHRALWLGALAWHPQRSVCRLQHHRNGVWWSHLDSQNVERGKGRMSSSSQPYSGYIRKFRANLKYTRLSQ